MKRTLLMSGLVLLAVALVATADIEMQLVADIPFGWHAGNKWMPPGEYTVVHHSRYLQVGSYVLGEHAMLGCFSGSTNKESRAALVFNKYPGEKYFLSEVYHPFYPASMKAPMSKTEREQVSSRVVSEQRMERVIVTAALRRVR